MLMKMLMMMLMIMMVMMMIKRPGDDDGHVMSSLWDKIYYLINVNIVIPIKINSNRKIIYLKINKSLIEL